MFNAMELQPRLWFWHKHELFLIPFTTGQCRMFFDNQILYNKSFIKC